MVAELPLEEYWSLVCRMSLICESYLLSKESYEFSAVHFLPAISNVKRWYRKCLGACLFSSASLSLSSQ